MAGDPYVEVYEDRTGRWRFRLVGGNGEIITQSEGYVSKDNAKRGAETAHPGFLVVTLPEE